MAPNEKSIILNIISLFQQLLSSQGGESEEEMTPIIEEAMDDEMEEEDVEKSVIDETADNKAEERIENVTAGTDQGLSDLKKSIQKLTSVLSEKKSVKKNVLNNKIGKDQSNQIMNQLTKALGDIVKKQNDQEKLMAQILDGLGFTDEIVKKTIGDNSSVQKEKPIQALDTKAMLKEVFSEVFKNIPSLNQNPEQRHPFNKKVYGNENLQGLAEYIHNQK